MILRPLLLLQLALILLALILLAVVPSANANILLAERGVLADGFADSASEYQAVMDDDFVSGQGALQTSATAPIAISQVNGASDASQTSFLDGGHVDFLGSASTNATLTGQNAVGDFISESSLYFLFSVSQAVDWWLSGSIGATSVLGGDAFASIDFSEFGGGTIFSALADNETTAVDASGLLIPGVVYEMQVLLRSSTLVDSDFSSGSGSATASLTMMIPEPGSGLLVSLGLALLSFGRRPTSAAGAGRLDGRLAEPAPTSHSGGTI